METISYNNTLLLIWTSNTILNYVYTNQLWLLVDHFTVVSLVDLSLF